MKRVFLLLTLLFLFSCDDGDLDIASFEFEEEVNHCGTKTITLYRLSTNGHKEVLMLTLTDQEIRNDEIEIPPIHVTKTGPYTVTDRIFDKEVTEDYFCALLPPISPTVIKNWEGESGTIYVENKPIYSPDGSIIISWEHVIVLQDLVLKSGGETLIFNDVYLFGTYNTIVN